MFINKNNDRRVEELENQVSRLKETIERHSEDDARLKETHRIEVERTSIKHSDELARVKANVDTTIMEKTSKQQAEVTKLTIENEGNKQKVSMYEKAFENLGFDVKDMKEILNKLVDGLVSKNQINLVSTK